MRGSVFRQRKPIIRCPDCGLKPYELSTSDYVRQIGAIVEDWVENYVTDAGDYDGLGEAIANDLQEIMDSCEESLENMPEGLQEGDVGSLLQERIDALEEAISQLTDYFDMGEFISRGYDNLNTEEQDAVDAEVKRREAEGKPEDYEEFYSDFWGKNFVGTLNADEKAATERAAESWKEATYTEIEEFISTTLGEIPY